ncbi:MAG: hypothetical protein WCJ58_01040 [bacterium]
MTQEEIKLQPHKLVNGIAILLIESEIAEFNQPLSEEELLNQLNLQKQIKINQLKANRTSEMEVETPKPSSLQVYEIDGVARTFKLKIPDIAILNSRIIRLQNAIAGTTAQWTDIDNNRLDLNLDQFKTLANHLDVRDQNLFTLYTDKLAEINACTTLEELNAININF